MATVRVQVQNEFSIKHSRCARNPEEHGVDGTGETSIMRVKRRSGQSPEGMERDKRSGEQEPGFGGKSTRSTEHLYTTLLLFPPSRSPGFSSSSSSTSTSTSTSTAGFLASLLPSTVTRL
jgi:hypothetical protein